MNKPALLKILCLGVLMTSLHEGPEALAQVAEDARLVRIGVHRQSYDAFHPWRTTAPSFNAGYGVQIDDEYVLTSEHLVRNHTLVEIQRPRSASKVRAEVFKSDHSLNLALLRLPPAAPGGVSMPGLAIAEGAALGDELHFLQLDDVRDMQRGPAQVQQIRVSRLPDAPTSLLVYTLLCKLNVNGQGAPVMRGNALAGIIIAFDQSTRIATMVSAPFLQRFIDDARTPPYTGTASAGFSWRPLVDPVKRRHLGVAQNGGILVLGTVPATGADEVLKSMDVILKWDGHPVDELGFYQDPTLGRLDFSHLIKSTRKPGDRITITVHRDGQQFEQELALGGDLDHAALIPENVIAERAEYIVAGGYVLRELDMHYLRSHGAKWRAQVNTRLMNAYLSARDSESLATDRIVIATDMLSDAINEGYVGHQNDVVTEINGQPIRNMGDVFRIQEADKGIHRISFKSDEIDVVFDPAQLAEANARIASQYRVPALSYRRTP